MMIGAGHMLDMIHKVKQNLSALPSNRQSKFKKRDKKSFVKAPKKTPVKHKDISDETLGIILSEIKDKALKERKRKLWMSIVSGLLTWLIFSVIAYFLYQNL